jgi:hypothetical protein
VGSFEEGILIAGLMYAIEKPSEDDPMSGLELMMEDEVKLAVKTVLEERGYAVEVAWGHARGVDLEARKEEERLLIEAKGDAPTPAVRLQVDEPPQRSGDAGRSSTSWNKTHMVPPAVSGFRR